MGKDKSLNETIELEDDLLRDYKNSVEALFSSQAPMLIANSNIKHATIINSMILKFAPSNGDVYFLCKNLHNDCFNSDEIIKSLDNALNRNVKVHVAYTDSISPQNRFLDRINSTDFPAMKVSEIEIDGKAINFSTNGKGFRFEPDAEKHSALVCPNDDKFSNSLINLFNYNCPVKS